MSGLDFGYVGGSNEVEQEVSSKYRFFGPLGDVEKGKRKGCSLVVEFFPVSNGGHN